MRELHYEGMRSDEVLGEAWRRLRKEKGVPEMTVQQRRYAQRKSFENPKRRRKKNPIAVYNPRKRKKNPGRGRQHPGYKGAGIETERKDFAYKRYLVKWNHFQDLFYISKEGHHIGSAKTVAEARKIIDEIAFEKNPQGVSLPMRSVEIRYLRSNGSHRGKWFSHKYGNTVTLIGLPNGNVLIKSNTGKKLWGSV